MGANTQLISMVQALNLIVIRCLDIDRAASFYEALGITFDRHRHGNGPEHLAAEIGPIVFELYPQRTEPETTAATRLGFRVASVRTAVDVVESNGGRIVSGPAQSPWGLRAVVEDPDGHRIELTQP